MHRALLSLLSAPFHPSLTSRCRLNSPETDQYAQIHFEFTFYFQLQNSHLTISPCTAPLHSLPGYLSAYWPPSKSSSPLLRNRVHLCSSNLSNRVGATIPIASQPPPFTDRVPVAPPARAHRIIITNQRAASATAALPFQFKFMQLSILTLDVRPLRLLAFS
jgi:hypothetical protein